MQEPKIHIYFKKPPEEDRFVKGDRWVRPIIRRIIRGKKIGGVEKVFVNLCKGLDLLKVPYAVNSDFRKIKPHDKVIALGVGKHALKGYNRSNSIVAGIALMTHPSEWPSLLTDYPVVKYLQHSSWATKVYTEYFGKTVCAMWPAGIDTYTWTPDKGQVKDLDFLIYNKVHNKQTNYAQTLVKPIKDLLEKKGYVFEEIFYGNYKQTDYRKLLHRSKAMLFISEHESQGFACCEALAMDVPILAWDNGFCLDPNRFKWNAPIIPATSVPFFDERCGDRFKNISEFEKKLVPFVEQINSKAFQPRDYILENLTLEKSAHRMLEILEEV